MFKKSYLLAFLTNIFKSIGVTKKALTGTLGVDDYRVPCTQVPTLVASHEVFIEEGFDSAS